MLLRAEAGTLMSIAELYELMYASVDLMDRIFEFWLTASFAVVVASHYVSDRLTTRLATVLAALYGLISLQLVVRYFLAIRKMIETRDILVSRGETFALGAAGFAGSLVLATFAVGIVSVLAFVWISRSREIES